ncbi:hypothetical protein [Roseomonas indoligenes]|uniref:Uncharacterized protein n=1 Tax=Roseomonas indoligenes TaxID=2820811 RepID=A0A940MWQ6_9PROT|nr:hypothetical protein [Pararoseomonas indoligenes]MBP0492219.1 hypothetical protein [Pararoseomonas indoligenes]
MTRYRPTEMECRCMLCGDQTVIPNLWFDTEPPDRKCVEGAQVVTDCRQAMERAGASAWLLKTLARKDPTHV